MLLKILWGGRRKMVTAMLKSEWELGKAEKHKFEQRLESSNNQPVSCFLNNQDLSSTDKFVI